MRKFDVCLFSDYNWFGSEMDWTSPSVFNIKNMSSEQRQTTIAYALGTDCVRKVIIDI